MTGGKAQQNQFKVLRPGSHFLADDFGFEVTIICSQYSFASEISCAVGFAFDAHRVASSVSRACTAQGCREMSAPG
jgi:hypothetical protein